jgi:hypothetical protein
MVVLNNPFFSIAQDKDKPTHCQHTPDPSASFSDHAFAPHTLKAHCKAALSNA